MPAALFIALFEP